MTKKTTKKTGKRKNAKPETIEESLWGTQVDHYMLDLALTLTEGLSHDEGTAKYREAVACLNSDVLPLMIDDIQSFRAEESEIKKLADAIEFVNALTAQQFQPWVKNPAVDFPAKKKYYVAFKIKLELDEGRRDEPPTVEEFLKMLKKAGCVGLDHSNARKLAKEMDWTPKKERPGPKP